VTTFKVNSDMNNSNRGKELFLLRSYRSTTNQSPLRRAGTTNTTLGPSRVGTGETTTTQNNPRRFRNAGQACQFLIWEVAYAASAAQHIIKPLKKEVESGSFEYYSDGGRGPQNNPTREGIREVREQEGEDMINIVVSVGTSRKNVTYDPEARIGPHTVKELADEVSDPEAIHEEIQNLEKDYTYYRFNDPGRLDIQFDEWKPRKNQKKGVNYSGYKTVKEINSAFKAWQTESTDDVTNDDLLKACARQIVDVKRKRMFNEEKWERFTMCSHFLCAKCGHSDILYRQEFVDHLKGYHQLSENSREFKKILRSSSHHWKYKPNPVKLEL
jgi:hypothetical protein